jgi:hypothetical protein
MAIEVFHPILGLGPGAACTTTKPGRIDHVAAWLVGDRPVDGVWLSDHAGVLVDPRVLAGEELAALDVVDGQLPSWRCRLAVFTRERTRKAAPASTPRRRGALAWPAMRDRGSQGTLQQVGA